MTRDEFQVEMDRMLDLKNPPGAWNGHWDALKDIPLVMLKSAVTHALKTRAWFPTGAELRADVDHIAREMPIEPDDRVREVPLEAAVSFTLPTGKTLKADREWRYDCQVCSDMGMQSFWCGENGPLVKPWYEFRHCGRRHEHGSHEWVGPCPCADHNPTIKRRKASQAKYAKPPEKVHA